ncbi:hypothetical protein GOBAR_AA35709 [Gossypium barbadense]|uniref:Uncharacterized protein n=1 Tax=Gossypium barbadense TaxID=3634 RepID=A0A2P5W1P0_GOSBA|nr:hypothetical protein GOBAR_AA35709 [Gossypium barbadense]
MQRSKVRISLAMEERMIREREESSSSDLEASWLTTSAFILPKLGGQGGGSINHFRWDMVIGIINGDCCVSPT